MYIYDIESPQQIKSFSLSELKELAEDIRHFLLESIAKTGGHLSGNLGVVELTLAMHYVFDAPKDKILFDVGHQCYTHKILTGRSTQFSNLRKLNGLSGFQKRSESVYDCWEAGHSSTSLSAALGFAIARDIRKEDHQVVALIGDGALTGGMALEALQDIGSKRKNMIIIFNDNTMSISKNNSGIEKRITSIRSSRAYRNMKKGVKSNLNQNRIGKGLLHTMEQVKERLKDDIIDAPLFQEFNLDYIGPIDGHDIKKLIHVLQMAKNHEGPIVVHVLTQKGKGYALAENDSTGKWHGTGPFDIQTGRSLVQLPKDQLSWSEVISTTLIRLAATNRDIAVITPAMAAGSKLQAFAKLYPERFFDCGIAEQHAITMAGAMAEGGLRPFVSVYSSFLQRAYDQMNHDIGRMHLPVVVGIDRAGLVGSDGETHQGIYDISMLRNIPDIILSQPKDAKEAQDLLFTAFSVRHPFCIRYPRGTIHYEENEKFECVEIGSWTRFQIGTDPQCVVIAYGPDVDKIISKAQENQYAVIVVNARFFKPIDTELIRYIYDLQLPIHIFETDTKIGGLSSAVLECLNTIHPMIHIRGIEDHYVPQGSLRALRIQEHIAIEDLMKALETDG